MRVEQTISGRILILAALAICLVLAVGTLAGAEEFRESLSRVDQALQKNPNFVGRHALYACQDRRARAAQLFDVGQETRAVRSLKYCFALLGIPEEGEEKEPASSDIDEQKRKDAAEAKIRKRSAQEFEDALSLTPDMENGLEVYRGCAACHTQEGWGMPSGVVPQLAGQHRKVVIKQLADIRAGYRENRVMLPYSSPETIGGPQAVADVAGYIDTLEISIENGKGKGDDLERAERLYGENCARCHGVRGEGDNEKRIPRIQAQHYNYLVTQFELIRDGKRRNADPEMVAQIKAFEERDIYAVMDYVARLEPPEALQAPPGWRNPDFAQPRAGN